MVYELCSLVVLDEFYIQRDIHIIIRVGDMILSELFSLCMDFMTKYINAHSHHYTWSLVKELNHFLY